MLKKVLSNLSETSCALRRFCLKFGLGFLSKTPMNKAHVLVVSFSSLKRRAGHVEMALQVGSL